MEAMAGMETTARQDKPPVLLSIKDLSKAFGSTKALQQVSMDIEQGEVHALVGENGAGKSTLIKILSGVYAPDSGTLSICEETVERLTVQKSRALGISVIHQERNLVPAFNGVENIFLGQPHPTRFGCAVDFQKMRNQAEGTMRSLGIELDLTIPASKLMPQQQMLIEIIRTMMTSCKLLILDEPTASFTDKETQVLFNIIERLKRQGVSVLYVSHRLEEVLAISDRITILKNGTQVGTFRTQDTNKNELITRMTDHWVGPTQQRDTTGERKIILQAEHIASKDHKVKDISLQLHSGEILGVFGLGGSGRTELLETLYGFRPLASGEIRIDGQVYQHPSCSHSLEKGMVLICEDRRNKGIFPRMSVMANTILSTLSNYRRGILMDERQAEADTVAQMELLHIKTQGPHQRLWQLSGGNQQKVVFAKALMSDPHIWLCDEPTIAIDVGTRSDIHTLLRQRTIHGDSVLFVSSDLMEILEISDRILVIAEGKSIATLENNDLQASQILAYCYGENTPVIDDPSSDKTDKGMIP